MNQHLEGKQKVIMHCMLSQKRGPRCAAVLAQKLEQLQAEGKITPDVIILKGGWDRFGRLYGSNTELTEVSVVANGTADNDNTQVTLIS